MKENEEKIQDVSLQKAKIRERYKGINQEELDIIPAIPQENFYNDTSEKQVGVYVRVSTDDPRQTSSYELQKNHYQDLMNHHLGWNLVEIYADEGISGTSLLHRDSFIRMIADCKQGRLDLIVTKSVSRFARNVVDCIKYVRELKALRPPVGIFFEAENIYTLDPNSEMSLSFISTLAQEESHNKSEIMNVSIEMRFKRGIFLTPSLLGYDQDEDGNLVLNEEEAKTVRLAFFMYLYGYSSQQIADTFTRLGRKTKKGKTVWSTNSIIQILQNERHCGDVLARKTWTPSYLDHKTKKNHFDRNQYRQKNHHEAIVSRDDFIAVQRMISNAKYGNKGFLPELRVISYGILKGYVSVNPRWAGFKAEDYRLASASIDLENPDCDDNSLVEVEGGSFDLRGFEIARAEFFSTSDKPAITLGSNYIYFNTISIQKFKKRNYVELLVHPEKMMLAVRPCTKDTKNAIQWAKSNNKQLIPNSIWCMAYISTLFSLFGWNKELRYRIIGQLYQKDEESFLLFDLHNTEVSIPFNRTKLEPDAASINKSQNQISTKKIINTPKNVIGYPIDWVDNFGNAYYSQQMEMNTHGFSADGDWESNTPGVPYKEPDLNVTSPDEVTQTISLMINEMKKEIPYETGKLDETDTFLTDPNQGDHK